MGEKEKIRTIISNTVRGVVSMANEESIKKKDIISLIKENGQFILVYYK